MSSPDTPQSVSLCPQRGEGSLSAANCGSFDIMTTAEIVEYAGRLLADAAPAESKVILFGSHGRGDAGADSDFDFLVIEPSVASKDSHARLAATRSRSTGSLTIPTCRMTSLAFTPSKGWRSY